MSFSFVFAWGLSLGLVVFLLGWGVKLIFCALDPLPDEDVDDYLD